MINDLNRVVLMGHLGADATQKSPKAPVTFSLATTSRWTDEAGEKVTRTEWHNVAVFNNLGKYAALLKKGDRVYLEGELRHTSYEKNFGEDVVTLHKWEVYAVQIDQVAAKSDGAK